MKKIILQSNQRKLWL